MSRFDSLGNEKEARTRAGIIHYRERGHGEPIVFLHGLLVNGDLWRKVVPLLAGRYRCITPDLPLGSHGAAMTPAADLSPPGVARLVVDFLDTLGLGRVTLVGNDTGGGLAQMVTAGYMDRVERLVLTPSDCFDIFPPRIFDYFKVVARVPGGLYLLAQSVRIRAVQRLPIAFGWLAKRPIDDEAVASYLAPGLHDAAIRRDTAKFIRGISPRYTLEAALDLERFERPVLLAWARADRLFPWRYAERLARSLPNARLVGLDDSYSFVPEDQPAELARVVGEFMEQTSSASARPDGAAVESRSGSLRA